MEAWLIFSSGALEDVLRKIACIITKYLISIHYPISPYDSRINEFPSVMDYQLFPHLFNKGNIVNSAVKVGLHL